VDRFLRDLVLGYFVCVVDVGQEDCTATVLFDVEVVKHFALIFSIFYSFLVFFPFVADYLAAAHAAYWKFHCVLPVRLLLFVSSSFARLAWFSGFGSSRVFDYHVSVVLSELSFQIVASCPFD
jgi:hypothetical protein